VGSLRPHWQLLDRGARVALVGIVALLAGAVAVRAWLVLGYRSAFLGFPDSGGYAVSAARNIFREPQRPAGYPFFLRLVSHFDHSLSFTIAVQHAMGIATGVLLYKAVRRTSAPPWLGLLPAAIVFFGATGLFLEHSLLADPLFAFLQAVAVYAAIRALYDPPLRWPLLAGLAIGLAFWVKTSALSSAVLVPLVLLCAAPGGVRRRLLGALATAGVAIALILVYVGAQYYFTGYLGYERQSAWDLYGRVATFVDCSRFTPPRGTTFLCPRQPLGHRLSQNFYQYSPAEPAAGRFGPPWEAPLSANSLLERFSVAAIEHEPVAYAQAIGHGLGRYLFPRRGEGYTPHVLLETLTAPSDKPEFQSLVDVFYTDSHGYWGSRAAIRHLSAYERYAGVQGPLLLLLLIAALAGPLTLPRRLRWAAALFTFTALCSIVFASAGNGYDARYAYPTFGPLAAGAALGAWGVGSLLTRTIRRRGWAGGRHRGRVDRPVVG
jgi:hypothetical protein